MSKISQLGPINASWHITYQCNYDCRFCFRPNYGDEIALGQAKRIIAKLHQAGLKKISWGGGEPLMWSGILDLIAYTKRLGITTMLITNGELLTPAIFQKLGRNLDWLNLPLDGSNEEMQSIMTRKAGHFGRVLSLIRYAKKHHPHIRLKINTVAARPNMDDIVNIARLIRQYRIPRWKIFQFYPIRHLGKKNRLIFELKTSDFIRIKEEIMPIFGTTKQMVVFETNEDMERSYFAIAPSGRVYVSYMGKDYIVGDLTKDAVKAIWENELLDKLKYYERSKWVLKKSPAA